MLEDIEAANIDLDGVFFNADASFDCEILKAICYGKGIIHNIDENPRDGKKKKEPRYVFDNELSKNRFVVEQFSAWMDSFKSLLIRFET